MDLDERYVQPLRETLLTESPHRCEIRSGYHASQDAMVLTVMCHECDRMWRLATSAVAMVQPGYMDQWAMSELVPFFTMIVDTDCWGWRDRQYLAEWITHELVRAGAGGIETYALVSMASSMEYGRADQVVKVLTAMELVPEGLVLPAMIELPEGHLLRTW